jgi:hypothetical protein
MNVKTDIEMLNIFFIVGGVVPSTESKRTEMCVFHLNTHAANKQLGVMYNGTSIKHVDHPKYL